MYIKPEIESSYEANNLGKTLYDYVVWLKPETIVEFGALNGYSTIAMAMGCKENKKGKVKVYDLFEDYEYNASDFQKLVKNLKEYGLLDYVDIEKANFFDWVKTPEKFDLAHIDISNTGDILDIMWDNLKNNGEVLFEGGSEQRDNVGWMKIHNKKPFSKSKAKYEVINSNFPSISRIIW